MNNDDISTKPFENPEDTLKGKTGGDEYLREAGSDDDRQATNFIQEYEAEANAQNQARVAEAKESIKAGRHTLFDYEEKLAATANQELRKLDWPTNWNYQAFATTGQPVYFSGRMFETNYGLLILIRDDRFKFFFRAFTISKDIDTDYTAMKNLVSQAENMIDAQKRLLYLTNPRNEGDIITR